MIAPAHHLYTVEDLKRLLHGVRRNGAGWSAFCPAHDDKDRRSLSFREGDNTELVVKCFAGCTWDEIRAALDRLKGGPLPGKENPMPAEPQADRTKVRTHVYHNADGTVFGEKTKWSDGSYTWMRNGKPGLDGAKAPLYRLDKIQGKTFVFIGEGERDVESLDAIGITATCNPSGASEKIEDWHVRQLLDAGIKKAAVLYDNDTPGIKHGDDWAQQCQKAGINTRLVSLPNEVAPAPKSHGTDVTDYLEAGGTRESLTELVKQAAPYVPTGEPQRAPTAKQAPSPDDKPVIITNAREDMASLHTETYQHVVALNQSTPQVFQRSVHLVRVRPDDDGRPIIESFWEASFSGYLARSIKWLEDRGRGGLKPIHPPGPVVKNLLSRPDWDGVHVLRSLVQVPVFLADGTLVTTPGYHPMAKLWYDPPKGFTVTVPDEPTDLDVAQAAELLLELLEDFPFSGEASRAHAIASILLPYAREMIEGPTPLHVFDAPIQGAGKGLLIEIGSIMSTGAEVGMVSVPEKDENELRKRITAKLLGGSQYLVLDNIVHPLRSAAVASALIARYWDDRILGLSESRRLKNQAIWMATGNNVELARDIARRAIFCRLEPLEEDPYLREGFKHPDLKAWVRSQRTELVSAALTIIKAWIVSGRLTIPHQMIGSFEAWADTMAGILSVAEIKGFLGNFKDTAGAVDPETEEWRAFVKSWWEQYQGQQVGVADLVELARNGIVRPGEGELLALGKAISKMKGRIIGGKRIDQGQRSNKIRSSWKLSEPPKER